jgi:hypothetical protein
LNEIKRAHSSHPGEQGARQALSSSFLSFYYIKIICAHVHEEVGGGVKPVYVAFVLIGVDAEKIEDRTLASEHAPHKREFISCLI